MLKTSFSVREIITEHINDNKLDGLCYQNYISQLITCKCYKHKDLPLQGAAAGVCKAIPWKFISLAENTHAAVWFLAIRMRYQVGFPRHLVLQAAR